MELKYQKCSCLGLKREKWTPFTLKTTEIIGLKSLFNHIKISRSDRNQIQFINANYIPNKSNLFDWFSFKMTVSRPGHLEFLKNSLTLKTWTAPFEHKVTYLVSQTGIKTRNWPAMHSHWYIVSFVIITDCLDALWASFRFRNPRSRAVGLVGTSGGKFSGQLAACRLKASSHLFFWCSEIILISLYPET